MKKKNKNKIRDLESRIKHYQGLVQLYEKAYKGDAQAILDIEMMMKSEKLARDLSLALYGDGT